MNNLKWATVSVICFFGWGAWAGESATLSAPGSATLFLGEQKTFPVTFQGGGDFSGEVSFALESFGEKAGDDFEDSFRGSLSLGKATLKSGGRVTMDLTFQSELFAPSFDDRVYEVVATIKGGETLRQAVLVSVLPKVEIRLFFCDYKNKKTLDDCWDRPETFHLRPHDKEVELHFVNCDTESTHYIHGNRPIPHSDLGAPPMAAAPSVDECGGRYVARIAKGAEGKGSYYMHDTQGSGQARYIIFGVTDR